ncbi:nucleotidyltransferase domain-containing protein [Candidatus Stoquefichus massiliensis]|uniref:nucleotidyltransferase domain-containing protein n=1 Tax=Candidatus Stoquefichus massiliensis TaxID=1470350 RepID=UPI0004B7CC19|nr:nucleotidyltransferase domain-containing protein [Candidatus Stoquefichus massiliensis]
MYSTIINKLKRIEETENVTIIYAVESGSRAWGFESKDSDYDVRFIYVRKIEDYLSLYEKRDVIEFELNNIYDINGWDIQKVLKLAQKSNPTLYEWIHSPIIYKSSTLWNNLLPLLQDCYDLSKLIQHYYHMTHQHYCLQQKTVKNYFYSLRTLLCCLWIIHENTSPPISFIELMKSQLDSTYVQQIETLISIKKSSKESYISYDMFQLDKYIEEQLQYIHLHLYDLKQNNHFTHNDFNLAFLHILKETSR